MSIHERNSFDVRNYDHLGDLMQHPNFNNEWQNFSEIDSLYDDEDFYSHQTDGFNSLPGLKVILYIIYISIFCIGICGNVLVCYIVLRNKSMHNVRNYFILNVAFSNILLCIFSLPFTPLYMFMKEWAFGQVFCHLYPYIQCLNVYLTAFTLMSIAIDRYFVMLYPLKTRLQLIYCYFIIVALWILAGSMALPYGIFMVLIQTENAVYCDEVWPHESTRIAFSILTSIFQFVLPFVIIIFCYLKICIKGNTQSMPQVETFEKEEIGRTCRTNKMLITMIICFGISWLPLNIYNFIIDLISFDSWKYLNVIFIICHVVAMSSICYNPFLYAWLDGNFRYEFMTALSCFKSSFRASKMSKQEVNNEVVNPTMDTEV